MDTRPETDVYFRPLLEDIRDAVGCHRRARFISRDRNRALALVATSALIFAAAISFCILAALGYFVSANLDPLRDLPPADRPAALALQEKGAQFSINENGDVVNLRIAWVPNDSDFQHLAELSSLLSLTIADAPASDRDLANLGGHFGRLERLRTMRFENTQVSVQGVTALQEELASRPDIVLQLVSSR